MWEEYEWCIILLSLLPEIPPSPKINSSCCFPQVLLSTWETKNTDYAGESCLAVCCRLRQTAGAEWWADGNSQSFCCSDCKALHNSHRSKCKETAVPVGYADTMFTKNPLPQSWGWIALELANFNPPYRELSPLILSWIHWCSLVWLLKKTQVIGWSDKGIGIHLHLPRPPTREQKAMAYSQGNW